MHGWEGRGAQLGSFVEPLLARGFSVVTFDAPAHGVSPGERATIPDFAEAARAVARKIGPIHAVIAHSLGSLAALLVLRGGLSARALVLIGAPSPSAAFGEFRRQLEIPGALVEGVRSRIEGAVGISFADIEGPALARGLRVPALLVHDGDDKEAALENSRAIAGALPGSVLLATEGLGHRRIVKDASVVKRVVEFVSSVSPGPIPPQKQPLTG
jgi:pimeloyl-ACP methyl ester carboxylesterase